MDLVLEGLNLICESEDRSQPPGNFAQLESVGIDKGESEGRGRGSLSGRLVRFFCGSCNPPLVMLSLGLQGFLH